MLLIAWLGNPGKQYQQTRHNAWFWAVNFLQQEQDFAERKHEKKRQADITKWNRWWYPVIMIKPQSYMNKSWWPVSQIASFFKIAPKQILILHDEIDFPTGKIKYKQGGSHAGHNGLKSIIHRLGTNEFPRIRIGIDRPTHRDEVINYVLTNTTKQEQYQINNQMPIIKKKIENRMSTLS
jgi:PTH1 family peptidyl-tRNA hydrolase